MSTSPSLPNPSLPNPGLPNSSLPNPGPSGPLSGPARFRQQFWMLDNTVRTLGVEWDQARLGYALGPIRDDRVATDMALIRQGVTKWENYTPIIQSVAARRQELAEQAEEAGHPLTAQTNWYAAAQLWALSTWPIWQTTPELVETARRQDEAYRRWGGGGDHLVELVDIPFRDKALPAYFHLPPGFDGTPVPTVLAIPGMDAGREILVARVGDELLARGFAVLAVDGPGLSGAAIRGVHTSPEAWIEAGGVLVDWLRARPEVDADRLVCTATSFGSFFATFLTAHQPGAFRGVGVAMAVFEPGAHTIFEVAAPTYKARHMWMAGLERDEAAFDEMVRGYDLRKPIADMTTPWFVATGEADELSPVSWVHELAAACPAPTTALVYDGARHSLDDAPSLALGPTWHTELVDWLQDRAEGRPPAPSSVRRITRSGAEISSAAA